LLNTFWESLVNQDEIQAEIDGKHRCLAREFAARKMWLMIALTGFAVWFVPAIGWAAMAAGLLMSAVSYSESIRFIREISALAKQRKAIDEQIDDFVQERGGAIRRRMQAMMEQEARDLARRRSSPSMFKGNCVDITEKS
jgi:hypothetical protein